MNRDQAKEACRHPHRCGHMPPAAWQPSAVQPFLTARSPPGRFRGHHSPGSAFLGACACGKSPFSGFCKSFRRESPSGEQFQFETLCIPNHTACHFAEKTRFFRLVLPGGAVPPPHIVPFSKIKRSIACSWGRIPLRLAVDAGMGFHLRHTGSTCPDGNMPHRCLTPC